MTLIAVFFSRFIIHAAFAPKMLPSFPRLHSHAWEFSTYILDVGEPLHQRPSDNCGLTVRRQLAQWYRAADLNDSLPFRGDLNLETRSKRLLNSLFKIEIISKAAYQQYQLDTLARGFGLLYLVTDQCDNFTDDRLKDCFEFGT